MTPGSQRARAATRALSAATVLLALLGIGLSVEHLLDSRPYNPGFARHPFVIRSHVVLGALYLALALPQLVPGIRRRRPSLHRAVGRIAAGAGVAAGLTALLVTALFPYSGPLAMLVVGPFAAWFLASLVCGFRAARRRDFAAHRAWMIRALAIGTSIATMRLIFVPAMLLLGAYGDESMLRWLSLASFAAAFALHAAVGEAWIRSTRRGGAWTELADGAPLRWRGP
jgi:uncharacterized membrane protein YozB (DUF420 family)